MPKQGSNSRVSVSVHICWCECERVFACRSQCEWWEYSHIRIARARISLHFVLARRLSTHRTEFASGPQLRNRNCSSHCILASCFLGPFLSVSVLFWHAQRQSRLQFSACFNESSRASRAAASYSAFLSRRQANCAYSFKYSVIVAPKRKHQLQPFGIFSSYRTQPAIGLQL